MNYIEFKTKILDYFKDMEDIKIRQSKGTMYVRGGKNVTECGSCVGAHIAYLFNLGEAKVHNIMEYEFTKGREFFYENLGKYLGLEELQVGDFFCKINKKCVHDDMFGPVPWRFHPYYTLSKMFALMDGEKTKRLERRIFKIPCKYCGKMLGEEKRTFRLFCNEKCRADLLDGGI